MLGMPTDTDRRSSKHRLIDTLLASAGQPPLLERTAAGRAAGHSWRRIAGEISSITGEDLPPPTLILWCKNYTDPPADAVAPVAASTPGPTGPDRTAAGSGPVNIAPDAAQDCSLPRSGGKPQAGAPTPHQPEARSHHGGHLASPATAAVVHPSE